MHARARITLAIIVAAFPADAAQFQFNTLIRLGATAAGAANWELGMGDNSGASPSIRQQATWTSGQSRQFQVTYTNSTNNAELRLFSNDGSSSVFASVTPSASPAAPGTTWTLPATSFFARAVTGANVSTSISVSGLSVVSPATLSVLAPVSTGTFFAQSGPFPQPTQTVTQSQDITFAGDASGNWRLQGFVTMNFTGLTGGPSSRDLLQFGVGVMANDVTATPEPGTWALLLTGFAAGFARSKRIRAKLSRV